MNSRQVLYLPPSDTISPSYLFSNCFAYEYCGHLCTCLCGWKLSILSGVLLRIEELSYTVSVHPFEELLSCFLQFHVKVPLSLFPYYPITIIFTRLILVGKTYRWHDFHTCCMTTSSFVLEQLVSNIPSISIGNPEDSLWFRICQCVSLLEWSSIKCLFSKWNRHTKVWLMSSCQNSPQLKG